MNKHSDTPFYISSKNFDKWVFGILTAGILYRMFFAAYFYGGDEVSYFHTITDILKNNAISNPHFEGVGYSVYYFRILMYIPSMLCLKVFGHSYTALIIPVFFYSIGTIFLVMFIGKKLYSPFVAVTAGIIIAFLPLFALYSTVFIPDVPVTFFITASWVSFILGIVRVGEEEKLKFFERKSFWWFALTGVLTHIAFSIKEPGILLLGSYFFFVLFAFRKKGFTPLLIIGFSFLLSFLLFGFVFYIFTGKYLYQTLVFGDPLGLIKSIITLPMRPYIPAYPFKYFNELPLSAFVKNYSVYFTMIFQWDNTFGFYGILLLSGFVYFLFFKKNKTEGDKILLYVSVFIFLYLNFGTPDLSKYVFMPKCRRYLIPLLPPIALMTGVMLDSLLSKPKFRSTLLVLLAFIFLHGIYIMNGFSRYLEWGNDLNNWVGAIESIPDNNNTPIFIAGNMVEHMRLFVKPAKGRRLHDIWEIFNDDGTSDLEKLKNSYVVYNGGYYYWRRKQFIPKLFNEDFIKLLSSITPQRVYIENSTPLRDLFVSLESLSLIGKLGSREEAAMERHKVFIYRIFTHLPLPLNPVNIR